MKQKILLMFLSLATATVLAAEPETAPATLTLPQALERAMQMNTVIGRSRAEVSVAEDQRRLLFSALLPRVNATGALIRNTEQVSFGSGADARTILPMQDWNAHIVVTQPVYAGNRERRAYDQAKLLVQNARQGQDLTEDQVLLRVASNFLAIVDADQLIEIEKKNIALAERRKKQATDFYEAGESTKVDVLRADTAIKVSQRALSVAEQLRETATGLLRIDLSYDGTIAVIPPEHATPPVPGEPVLIQQAESSRPEIVQAENNVKIAELEVRKQRGAYLPTISAEAGYNAQKSAFPSPSYGYGALRFTVPILQSGEVGYRIAGARDHELEAKLALDEARLTVREDVRKALVDLHSAETNLSLAKEQLTSADAEYAQSFDLYRAQEATSLDLASSETSLADARRAVAEQTLNRDLAGLRVWYAAGQMKKATSMESR